MRTSTDFSGRCSLLRIKTPDYLPRASACVDEAAAMVERLLELEIAYWHQGNVYFDPLKFPGFGKLYGLDMSRWPAKRRRFHRDTYPGIQWNLGDFILWHGYREGDPVSWNTPIGRGGPPGTSRTRAWSPAISRRPSRSTAAASTTSTATTTIPSPSSNRSGPIPWPASGCTATTSSSAAKRCPRAGGTSSTPTTSSAGDYNAAEIRFFLIDGHYREKLDYTEKAMKSAAEKLRGIRRRVRAIEERAGRAVPFEDDRTRKIGEIFGNHMDQDLEVKDAFDGLSRELEALSPAELEARGGSRLDRDPAEDRRGPERDLRTPARGVSVIRRRTVPG